MLLRSDERTGSKSKAGGRTRRSSEVVERAKVVEAGDEGFPRERPRLHLL